MTTEGIPADLPYHSIIVFTRLIFPCPAGRYRGLVGEVTHV